MREEKGSPRESCDVSIIYKIIENYLYNIEKKMLPKLAKIKKFSIKKTNKLRNSKKALKKAAYLARICLAMPNKLAIANRKKKP